MLKPGLSQEITFSVEPALTAKAVGSGTLEVLATPVMIAKMELAAWSAVADELPEGSSTVGTRMDIQHLSPTPLGMAVTCSAELTLVDNRRLVFRVSARDEIGVIGEGIHERAVIQTDRFLAKAQAKAEPNR